MDCFLHYRFQTKDRASLIRQCFQENEIEFREIDNLILLTSAHLSFTVLAIALYQKLSLVAFAKTDYLYLYTVANEDNWFCIIIKKIGASRIYNIVSRMGKNK
jgi:hypothetical protein